MKTHVVKTGPEASLAEAVDLMDIYQVNSMPVVDSQGCLCGIIAEQDVARAVVGDAERSAESARESSSGPLSLRAGAGDTLVREVMQRSPVSIAEEADVASILKVFFVDDFTRVPVIGPGGAVVGTLNRIDVVQAVFERTLEGARP